MQQGSLIRSERKQGPAVWQFRWSEKGPDGQRIYRKRVIGTVEEYGDAQAVHHLVKGLIAKPKGDLRLKPAAMTVAELCQHFQQRELAQDDNWRSYSTRKNYMALPHPRTGHREVALVPHGAAPDPVQRRDRGDQFWDAPHSVIFPISRSSARTDLSWRDGSSTGTAGVTAVRRSGQAANAAELLKGDDSESSNASGRAG